MAANRDLPKLGSRCTAVVITRLRDQLGGTSTGKISGSTGNFWCKTGEPPCYRSPPAVL